MATGNSFNLSQWALNHRSLLIYFIAVVLLFGVYGYNQLPQSEAPPFTFKVMVVKTLWPGATTLQVREQVTQRISRELRELPNADYVRAYSRPGESMIFFVIKDSAPPAEVPDTWYQVRKHVNDMRHTLPKGIIGPFFDDEFGDVYTNIYALQGKDYSYAELKDYADAIRDELLRVPGVAKVDFFGEQPERIYIDLDNAKLASLGLTSQQIMTTLKQQNAVTPAGFIQTASSHIAMRVTGSLHNVEDVRQLKLYVDQRILRLADIAHVYKGYKQPPAPSMRYNGTPVLGIGVTMQPSGNVVELGKHLDKRLTTLQQSLPVGLSLKTVTNMPKMVDDSISEFIHAVAEAIIIVLLVCLVSLGLRTGAVVVVAIPLVLAATALCMWLFGVGLNKVSLGTLILALGLLVDDAIIAIEMMLVKLEQGYSRYMAAGFAYKSTAFPMLTGTLITVAGFLPIAMAQSATGEYTRALFEVSTMALLSSWLVSVLVVPWLGYKLIPSPDKPRRNRISDWLQDRFPPLKQWQKTAKQQKKGGGIYSTPFYNWLRHLVQRCVDKRKTVLLGTFVIFVLALAAFKLVPQEFFPATPRPELLVNLRLAEGASRNATLQEVEQLEAWLKQQPEVTHYTAFVGGGAPRFFLPLAEKLPQRNFAQFIVVTQGVEARTALRDKIRQQLKTINYTQVRGRVKPLKGGPPISYPLEYRITGPSITTLRGYADQLKQILLASSQTRHVHFSWDEPNKVIRFHVNQQKAQSLGLNSQAIAHFLQMTLQGTPATYLHQDDERIAVVLRAGDADRNQINRLKNLSIHTATGQTIPLSQVVKLQYVQKPGIVWSRNGQPVISVRADVEDGAQGIDVANALAPQVDQLRHALATGYHIQLGGAAEANAKAQASINAGFPFMLFVIFTLLMLQLKSLRRSIVVVLTAPLGLIGVVLALLIFDKPFGFVAMVGTIAMFGIIMRNSVILVDQIDQDLADGASMREAIVEATVRRFRPIMLTASAAVLALIPLVPSSFFGPMAVSLMGGITIATILTSIVLPAMFAVFMRLRTVDG